MRSWDIPKQSSAAQVYKELRNCGMIQVNVFPSGWGAWTMETMEQESWGLCKGLAEGTGHGISVGENRELEDRFLL